MKHRRIVATLVSVVLIPLSGLHTPAWSGEAPAWQKDLRPDQPAHGLAENAAVWPVEIQQLRAALDRNREELQWVQELLQQAGETLYWAQTRHQQSVAAQRSLADQLGVMVANYQAQKAQLAQMATELRAVKTSLTASRSPVAAYQARIQSLENERERLHYGLAERDRQLARLQSELQASHAALRQARSESADSHRQLLTSSTEHETCQTQQAALNAELRALRRSAADAQPAPADSPATPEHPRRESPDQDDGLDLVHTSFAALEPATAAGSTPAAKPTAARVPDTTPEPPQHTDAPAATEAAVDTQATAPQPATGSGAGNEADSTVSLLGVKFRYDSAELTPESRAILDTAARNLRQQRGVRHEVAGHTDSQGNPAYNIWLSQQRAQAVKAYLVSRGVSPYLLEARGYGGTQPVADNRTWEGLVRNRRVELRWIP